MRDRGRQANVFASVEYLAALPLQAELRGPVRGVARPVTAGTETAKRCIRDYSVPYQTRPGRDLPRTCLKGGIFGASVTVSSLNELARM